MPIKELPIHSKKKDYAKWLIEVKKRLRSVQFKASVTVNQELLMFYWEFGADIVEKQKSANWGDGFLKQLSLDLVTEFPEMKGFSERNLKYIRQWFLFWHTGLVIGQQPVAQSAAPTFLSQITQIPWGHNIAIITKCKLSDEALYYAQNTLTYGWGRSVLIHQIDSGLWQREGKAVTNFNQTLPPSQSDLALQTLKDPYVFDFLNLAKEHNERELEQGLIKHITHFLLELGTGFAYIGRQVPLHVGERDFLIDLLFYHTQLHCYVVVDLLKAADFEPEHAGKLNFYLKAVDEQLRRKGDHPSIGLLLCQSRDRLVAEYALSDIHKPIGISEYQLTQMLPDELKSSLPTVEQIEVEFKGDGH